MLSAALQLCTHPIYDAYGRSGVYLSLSIAMVMFAVGNGLCEVVVNPMVATLFPQEKTHYLNSLRLLPEHSAGKVYQRCLGDGPRCQPNSYGSM